MGRVKLVEDRDWTYTFKQVENILASLVADLVDVEFGARSHGGSQRIGAGELESLVGAGAVR